MSSPAFIPADPDFIPAEPEQKPEQKPKPSNGFFSTIRSGLSSFGHTIFDPPGTHHGEMDFGWDPGERGNVPAHPVAPRQWEEQAEEIPIVAPVMRLLRGGGSQSTRSAGQVQPLIEQKRYSEALGHGLASAVPGGGLAEASGEAFGRGDTGEGFGNATLALAPYAVHELAPVARRTAESVVPPVVRGVARGTNAVLKKAPGTIGAGLGAGLAHEVGLPPWMGGAAGYAFGREVFPRIRVPGENFGLRDPQLSLFRNTPKLGNVEPPNPLAVENPALPRGEITQASPEVPPVRPLAAGPEAQEQPPVQPPASVDDMLANIKGALDKKYPEAPPIPSPNGGVYGFNQPGDPTGEGLYGEYSGKSNLKGNERQLYGPTTSTAPNPTVPQPPPGIHPPEIERILRTPGEPNDEEMRMLQNYFSQQRQGPQLVPKTGTGIGPGTAHVTDPGFSKGEMGAHADYLNNLPDLSPRRSLNFSHVYDYNNAKANPWAAAPDDKVMSAVGKLQDKYQTDPQFQKLADAARMYVHNYHEIGDIDKISLGIEPVHTAWHQSGGTTLGNAEIPDKWNVDPDTRMFDGTPFGKDSISYHEGSQMAEALSSAIREAKERDIPLWRGVTPYRAISNLKAGDTVTLPLSSFSEHEATGANFGNNFVFELTGPSKHLNLKPFNSMLEGEHLTQGQFEVTGIGEKTIEHPPFHAGGKSVSETVRYVKIRQKGAF